jgi:hypothetical protein
VERRGTPVMKLSQLRFPVLLLVPFEKSRSPLEKEE